MPIDILTTGVGLISFGLFLLVQVITFRWVRPEYLLRSLLLCVIFLMLFPVVLMGFFYHFQVIEASLLRWGIATAFAVVIQGLLCFVYVLCIFGPYETSVRTRLIREIAKGKNRGIKKQELLSAYNAKEIVNIRLQRLIGSGDILEENGNFRMGRSKNFFFIFDAIAGVLKKWIEQ